MVGVVRVIGPRMGGRSSVSQALELVLWSISTPLTRSPRKPTLVHSKGMPSVFSGLSTSCWTPSLEGGPPSPDTEILGTKLLTCVSWGDKPHQTLTLPSQGQLVSELVSTAWNLGWSSLWVIVTQSQERSWGIWGMSLDRCSRHPDAQQQCHWHLQAASLSGSEAGLAYMSGMICWLSSWAHLGIVSLTEKKIERC